MPSFFSKISSSSKKNNPYSNPNHPSHAPIPKLPSTSTTTSSIAQSQPQPTRPASPRGSSDFLAEARALAGRDSVTGRPLHRLNIPSQTANETGTHSNARMYGTPNAVEVLGPSEERSAYISKASKTKQTTGSKYDLFVKLMAEKKIKEEMERRELGKKEFYAPERQVSEFYAGGVRD